MYFALLRVCGVSRAELPAWWEAAARARRSPRGDEPESPAAPDVPAPYRGFSSYRAADGDVFFGRRSETAELVRRIRDAAAQHAVPRIVIVTGPSGIGKSSLVHAGLAGEVHGGPLTGVPLVVETPGGSAAETISAAAGRLAAGRGGPTEGDRTAQDAPADPAGAEDGTPTGILVLDQLGEIWTKNAPKAGPIVLDRILELASGPRAPVVVLALRASALEALTRHPAFAAVVSRGTMVVGPLTADALQEVIEGPAGTVGVALEPGLTELIVSDVEAAGGIGGVLPLLSNALLATWPAAGANSMTVQDYLDSGRLHGAAERTAEDLYQACRPAEQELIRRLFLAMVSVDGDVVTRRVAPLHEFGLTGDAASPAARLIATMAAERLIVLDGDGAQIAHPMLVEAWPRLAAWVDGDRANLALRRRLQVTAQLWDEAGRPDDLLLPGSALEVLMSPFNDEQRNTVPAGLNERERDLLAGSRRRADALARRERRRRRLLGALVTVAVVLALLASVGLVVAVTARDAARSAGDAALSRQIALQSQRLRSSDPALAAQFAVAAFRASPTLEARSNLLDTGSAPLVARYEMGGPFDLALHPGGDLILVRTAERLRVLRATPSGLGPEVGSVVLPRSGAPGHGIAVAGDGNEAYVGTEHGVLAIDLSTPTRPTVLGVLPGMDRAVAQLALGGDRLFVTAVDGPPGWFRRADSGWRFGWFPVDAADYAESRPTIATDRAGELTAVSAPGRGITLWDTSGDVPERRGNLTPPGESDQAVFLDFAADGRLAAALRSKRVLILDTAGDRLTVSREIGGFTTYATHVCFIDDGRTLLAVGADGRTVVVDLAGDNPTRTVEGPAGLAQAVPAQGRVFVSGEDGYLRTWPRGAPSIRTGTSNVFQIPTAADGRFLMANGALGGAVGLWAATPGPLLRPAGPPIPPPPGDQFSGALAITPDGATALLGTAAGDVLLAEDPWSDIRFPAPQIRAIGSIVETVAIDAAGRTGVAAGLESNRLPVFDLSDRRAPRLMSEIAVPDGVPSADLHPDGRLLAVGTGSGRVLLADLSAPAAPRVVWSGEVFPEPTLSVRFGPDGGSVIASSSTGKLALIDVRTPAEAQVSLVDGPLGEVHAFAFSPDSSRLAAAAISGDVWLYAADGAGPRHIATLTAGRPVWDVRFAGPDTLIASGADGNVHGWELSTETVINEICVTGSAPPTEAEWTRLAPDADHRSPCG